MLTKLLVMSLLCVPIFCAECHISTVQYTEVVTATNPDLDKPETLLPSKTAFGCVIQTRGVTVVIQDFSGDRPASVLVIPTGAVIKITGLTDVKPDEESFQKLPHAPIPLKGERTPNKEMI